MESTQWVGFHAVPGILIVRLMSRCNEKCRFCMVASEIQGSDDMDFDVAVQRIAEQPPATIIEFFGGEPTVYPKFTALLREARLRGYPCSVATNLRAFHSEKYTRAVAELGADAIYLRTSIYGHDAETHDYYTRAPGSYAQTTTGIERVVASGFPCQVNVVILQRNFDRLGDIVAQVHRWGVPRVKFGNLTDVATCAEHAVPLASVKPHLMRAIDDAERLGLTVTVEKTPICVAGGRIDLISTERLLYHRRRVFDDGGTCAGCLVRRWCDGVDPDYAERFGFGDLERLESVPARVARPVDREGEPELLKMYCVDIPDERPDAGAIEALQSIWQRVAEKHGDLAVFPRKYLREAAAIPAVIAS